MFRYDSNLKQVARGLRNGMTRSEQLLWSRLRGRQIQGIQFYRQNPIGVYIVDFYAPKAKLAVEVDGRQHLELDYRENDASRDAYLAGAGLSVLRFSNTQVSQELATVVTIIAKALLDRINPAQLLISGNTYQPTHFLTDNPTSPLS
ncbi:MAG: endonuclease domain-containing protein [Chloroflexota bacterium]|nr:endonuclease domain-containing protein [Chloroflexota bacterium]